MDIIFLTIAGSFYNAAKYFIGDNETISENFCICLTGTAEIDMLSHIQ